MSLHVGACRQWPCYPWECETTAGHISGSVLPGNKIPTVTSMFLK